MRKERLDAILREEAEEREAPVTAWLPNGTFTEGRHIANTLELTFPEKPPAWVRKALKDRRWRWSDRHRCWYRFHAIDRDKEIEFARTFTAPVKQQEDEAA